MIDFHHDWDDAILPMNVKDVCKWRNAYGQGCTEPLFYITNITIPKNEFQVIGKGKDTLKFVHNGLTYIKFHANDLIADLAKCDSPIEINLIGKANKNDYCGNITYQIFIEDWEILSGVKPREQTFEELFGF